MGPGLKGKRGKDLGPRRDPIPPRTRRREGPPPDSDATDARTSIGKANQATGPEPEDLPAIVCLYALATWGVCAKLRALPPWRALTQITHPPGKALATSKGSLEAAPRESE